MTDGQAERTLARPRRVLLGVSAGALATSAHAAAGGGLPHVSLTVVVTALIGWIAASLAEKAKGITATMAVLGAAQLATHAGMTTLHAPSGAQPAFDPLVMALAHVLATALTAVLLARADHGLRVVVARLRSLLPSTVPVSPVPPPPQKAAPKPAAAPASERHDTQVMLRRVCTRRGPPQLC